MKSLKFGYINFDRALSEQVKVALQIHLREWLYEQLDQRKPQNTRI